MPSGSRAASCMPTQRGPRAHGGTWLSRLGWGIAVWGTVAWAQSPKTPPTFQALRVDQEIRVDGILDEPFWTACPVATGLIDTRTHQPADQQTTIRIAYTATHLYIGVECFDDQIDQIRATERREDRSFTGDDWVEIHIDPTHSHRGKYAFFTNPLGTKADANEGPSGSFNYGWSADWECQAQIETNRWCFEMKIPFGIMNYHRSDGQTWGFNVTRCLRRTDQTSFWSFSSTEMYKPRHFGHLEGLDLEDTRFSRQWEVAPYVSGRYDFGGGDTDTVFKAGADVGFRLTPSITTALTLNPDYGQVEADDSTIELRDTERFLPEKRPFFREGEELMRMPNLLYYSRRFTDVDGGGKFAGAHQDFSFNFQNLYGKVEQQDFDGTGNSATLRVYQHLHERSHIGYYLADSELEEGYSRVGGADAYLFLTDDWRVSVQAAGMSQDLDDTSGTFTERGGDFLGLASLVYSRYPIDLIWGVKGISDGFKPLLGYIPRQNIFGPYFDAFYNRRANESWYKELTLNYEFDYYWQDDGELSIHDHGTFGRVVLPNDLGLRAGFIYQYHAPYYNHRVSSGFDLFWSDLWRSFSFTWANGEFEQTDYNELILAKPLKLWDRLPLRLETFVRFEDQPDGSHDTKWLARAVFDLYITDKMWVKGSLQPQNEDVHNLSLIYGWEFLPRKFFYFVLNSVNDDGEQTENSIFSKLVWTF